MQKVQKEKERVKKEFYFDAYHIRISGIKLIENILKETCRFHEKISN